MPWWAWALLGWTALAVIGALWLGAAAAIAKGRERAAREHQYDDEASKYRRWWGPAG